MNRARFQSTYVTLLGSVVSENIRSSGLEGCCTIDELNELRLMVLDNSHIPEGGTVPFRTMPELFAILGNDATVSPTVERPVTIPSTCWAGDPTC